MRSGALFRDLSAFGDAPALILESGVTVSYRDLVGAADELGGKLSEPGIGFILAENSAPSVYGYVGMQRAGVPAALLSSAMKPELLSNLFAAYQPKYVWLPEAIRSLVPDAAVLHRVDHYVLLDTGAEACAIHPDLALLTTTSGTTGSPKFVRQSGRNLVSNTRSIVEYLSIQPSDRAITSLPMHYVFGLSVINSHLTAGATVILTDRGMAEKAFWEMVKTHQATTFSGVPYTFHMLKQLRFPRMNLPSLKVLTQAGGKLPPDLAREFAQVCRDKDIRFVIMYGAAEATARMSYLPPERVLEKPGSIGIAIPGGTFSIVDEQGQDIARDDAEGELIYRGDNVTLGYAMSRADLARGDDNRGVLHTGDLARRDCDGFFYIVGRKSRFIKIFGNRVNLEDVEHYLRKLGIDSACAGRDELLRIYVVSEADRAKAASAVQEMTGLHPSAFSITVVARIPRNEAGKTLYAELGEG